MSRSIARRHAKLVTAPLRNIHNRCAPGTRWLAAPFYQLFLLNNHRYKVTWLLVKTPAVFHSPSSHASAGALVIPISSFSSLFFFTAALVGRCFALAALPLPLAGGRSETGPIIKIKQDKIINLSARGIRNKTKLWTLGLREFRTTRLGTGIPGALRFG